MLATTLRDSACLTLEEITRSVSDDTSRQRLSSPNPLGSGLFLCPFVLIFHRFSRPLLLLRQANSLVLSVTKVEAACLIFLCSLNMGHTASIVRPNTHKISYI